MSSARLAVDVGNGALIITFALALTFVIIYALTARWWDTTVGINVMGVTASIAAVTGLATLRIIYDGGAVFLWIRVIVFLAVPIFLAQRVWLLIITQVIDRRSTDDESDR